MKRKKIDIRLPDSTDRIPGDRFPLIDGGQQTAINADLMEKQLKEVFPGRMESSERFANTISKLQMENRELRDSLKEAKSTILELKRKLRSRVL